MADLERIIQQALDRSQALQQKNSDLRPRVQLAVTIPLDVASTAGKPFIISNPFDGFYVNQATDANTFVNMGLVSYDDYNVQNQTLLKLNDSAKFSEPITKAVLTWPAQAGKSITIIFYMGVDFKPGSFLLSLTGGVTNTNGSGMTPSGAVAVTNVATLLFAASSVRKKVTIQNLGGVDFYISGVNTVVGDSPLTAGNTMGIRIQPGAMYEWQNSGACYAITDAGSSMAGLNVEA